MLGLWNLDLDLDLDFVFDLDQHEDQDQDQVQDKARVHERGLPFEGGHRAGHGARVLPFTP